MPSPYYICRHILLIIRHPKSIDVIMFWSSSPTNFLSDECKSKDHFCNFAASYSRKCFVYLGFVLVRQLLQSCLTLSLGMLFFLFNYLSGLCYLTSISLYISGPGCSKLTTSLENVSLKFYTLISQISRYYFLLKKCVKLLQCKSFSHFFQENFQCNWL